MYMKLVAYLFASASLVACTGAQGTQGPAGADGVDGTNGVDGTALFVRTVVVSPDPNSASASGQALLTAMDGIDGLYPSLLRIEPGVYDLGDASLTTKYGVTIEGAGLKATRIVSASPTGATVLIADGTEGDIRNLTIAHAGGVDDAVALETLGRAGIALSRVRLEAEGGASTTVGLRARDLIAAVDQVQIAVRADTGTITGFECIGCAVNGGGRGYMSTLSIYANPIDVAATPQHIAGIEATNGSLASLFHVDVGLFGDSVDGNIGIDLHGGRLRADSLTLYVQGATDAVGIRVTDAMLSLRNSKLQASSPASAGVRTVDVDAAKSSSVDIANSVVISVGATIEGTADAFVWVAVSQLAGGAITGSATLKCYADYDENYAAPAIDACP